MTPITGSAEAGTAATLAIGPKHSPELSTDTNMVLVLLEPKGGLPESFSILINTTGRWPTIGMADLPEAEWMPFRSNLSLTLEPQRKRHTISVGYRQKNAPWPLWQEVGVTVTNLPPAVVLTNPLHRTTSTSLLQIQGFADVALKTISFTFEKPDGTTERGSGFVTRQEMQIRNPIAAVTNYFQCFDLELEPGTNHFSVNCTDIYGNSTVTNFSMVLDTASDRTPPQVTLFTPQPGSLVFQSGFTIYGRIDDPSGTMAGKVVSEGRTVEIESPVGRTGLFLFSEIPINGATNHVSLTATDLAGNVTTTNFVLIRSQVSVELDSIPDDKFVSSGMTVSGKVSVQDHALWVNGVRATINPDGTWSAKRVRVEREEGDGPMFNLKALPLTANTNAPGIQLAL